ncbi:hypothetical protein BGZ61DRAFT_476037 [Ilyonectria robusta]|uniref:uncharacterized protein n=1 Tax=Ilyonectria robusta TaxID=1079257 RepID=UPI001E8D6041|nr:uncharacterized protein BGZ61DRAFT_476037 [Ilyonectria robusta]KAH8722132.1 hypothetical protein BGZ61DRAFT_476037 [Ilyonectria robusta]
MIPSVRLFAASALLTNTLSLVKAVANPINIPSPMLQPAFPACEQFHLAIAGEDCNSIIASAQLDWYEFFRINPAIGGEQCCTTKILADTWYCVKARGSGDAAPSATHEPEPKLTKTSGEPKSTTKSTKTMTTKTKNPEITKAPVPNYNECRFGDCWYAFGELSRGNDENRAEASSMCSRVFAEGCKEDWDWPGKVGRLCNGCKEFSSACPCFLAGHYHTRSNNALYTRKGQQGDSDFLPSDD